jgi:hypothetical protein
MRISCETAMNGPNRRSIPDKDRMTGFRVMFLDLSQEEIVHGKRRFRKGINTDPLDGFAFR